MSAETVKSSSSNNDGAAANSTDPVDNSDYVYEIPTTERTAVEYYLNQDDVWEEAARIMGYSKMDIIVSFYCILFMYKK